MSEKNDIQHTVRIDLRRRRQMVRAIRLSSLLLALFALNTLLVTSSNSYRRLDGLIGDRQSPRLHGLTRTLVLSIDNLGLRGLSATLLLLAAFAISLRFKSWRPLNLSFLALLGLNVVVGALKILLSRSKPRDGSDLFHIGGVGSYPSGHAANAILTWGVLAYLIYRYTHRALGRAKILQSGVALVSLGVSAVSLYRNTHWLSDLVGGLLIGGSLLVLVIAVDRYVPSAKQPVQS